MRKECSYCKSIRLFWKMGSSQRKPNKDGWITKRYFICRQCNSLIIDIIEYDNDHGLTNAYTETYLEEDLDYTDINDIKIKPEAVCYEKR